MGYLDEFFNEHKITDEFNKACIVMKAKSVITANAGCIDIQYDKVVKTLSEGVDKHIVYTLDSMTIDLDYIELGSGFCKSIGFKKEDELYDALYKYLKTRVIPEFMLEVDLGFCWEIEEYGTIEAVWEQYMFNED